MDFYITDEEYEIASKNGIYPKLLETRVRSLGWNKERAMTENVRKKGEYQNHGTFPQIAVENNIPQSTYYARVKGGMSKEEASTRPLADKRKWAKKMRKRIAKKYDDEVYENLAKNDIPHSHFYSRVNTLGWSIERASTEPVTRYKKGD